MAGRNYRLIIRHHGWEKDVLNVNLNDYLLLTKMEGHRISPQEYLDRQDEYSIIFFLTPKVCPDCPDKPTPPDPSDLTILIILTILITRIIPMVPIRKTLRSWGTPASRYR